MGKPKGAKANTKQGEKGSGLEMLQDEVLPGSETEEVNPKVVEAENRAEAVEKENELLLRRALAAEALLKSRKKQGDDGSGASRRSRTRSGERSRRTGSKETPRRSRSKDTPRRSASEGGNSDDGGNKRTSRRERRNFVRDRSVSKSRKRRRSGSSDEGERRRRRYERSRSKDREEEELSKVERVARRIAQEEIKSRDGKKWNKVGNQKQYDFNAEVIQNGEELVETLEKEFQGMSCPVPTSVEQIMKKGIEMMTKRNMDLRRADDAGWDAVEMYHRDPLCDTENDEKRWKKAKLEAKEKREKEKLRRAVSRGGGAGGSGVGRGKSKDVYFPVRGMRPLEQPYSYGFGFPSTLYGAGGGRGGGFVPRGGRGWHDSVRRPEWYAGGRGEFQGNCRRCGKWGHKAESCNVSNDKK